MRKILAKSLLAATLITNTAYADENTQPTAEDRGATSAKVHIQINPELSKREDAYKQAVEKLSAEQQKQLENLDTQITQAHEPEISVAVQSSVFKACTHRLNLTAARKPALNARSLNTTTRRHDFIRDCCRFHH